MGTGGNNSRGKTHLPLDRWHNSGGAKVPILRGDRLYDVTTAQPGPANLSWWSIVANNT